MTGLASRIDGVVAGWVHSQVAGETERAHQTTLFRALVIACPALMAGVPLLLIGSASAAAALAAGIAASALPMLVAAVLCVTGSRRSAAWSAAGFAAAAIAALWLAGAPSLPSALLAAKASAVAGALGYFGARLTARDAGGRAEPVEPAETPIALHELLPGLVTVHDLSGTVLAVHGADAPAYREWLARPMGRGFFQQIHVGDRIAFLQAIDALRRGEARSQAELRMHRATFEPGAEQFVHLHVDFTPIPGEDGTPHAILAQSRDVTQEAALRRDAAEKATAAESANAAKTRFLAAVSHELRTPLNAIIGFSDVLAQEYFGRFTDERQREYVELIRQSGAHLLSVVNTMLDMSRIEAGRFELIAEPFDVAEAVAACESMLSLQARQKGVTLTSRVNRDCGELVADRRALNQILINLVANAVKFTEKGGVVTIDAGLAGDRLRFSVSDTGIGISAEELADLGRPFVQAQSTLARRYEGTGLGLSLVKGLVALHGGAFEIMSAPGEGTVVTVELARDGSGIRAAEPQPPAACAVEFPPRLVATTAERKRRETDGYDDAQARTA